MRASLGRACLLSVVNTNAFGFRSVGTPPVKRGRPLPFHCQPNKDAAGNPAPRFGDRDPEDLFGRKGWCNAEEPEGKQSCPCILVRFSSDLCFLNFGGTTRVTCKRPRISPLLLLLLCRMGTAAHIVTFHARRTAPTNAVVRASGQVVLESCLSPVSCSMNGISAAACRAWGVQHGILQVPRGMVGPGLRQPHPRHTMDARWLLPAAAAAAAAASSISVCFTILLLSLLQAWRRRGPG